MIAALLVLVAQASELEQRVTALLPKPEEQRWLDVGWEPNLFKARAEAQKLGRPLLVWIMDGNVLGCT